jgi:acetylornithine deacetylase/succinyl-diaminopimelate desuccinylase-like protein
MPTALPPLKLGLAALLALAPVWAQTPAQREARDILEQLIAINTTDSSGDNTRAAEAMAVRFRAAGFSAADVQVLAPAPRKGNLVVRLRGSGAGRPILFIGHLDVVEALRSDWSYDPFVLTEKDGYFYGRGTADMKGDVAAMTATFLRLKKEGVRPARDLILALTADEEGGSHNGVDWLMKNHRELVDAEFAINTDAGGGHIKNGKRLFLAMQAAEKVYLSFRLEVTNPGGHSSRPPRENAIYRLAEGLGRLARYDFPVRLFDVTRASFERAAPLYPGRLGTDLAALARNPGDAAAAARLSELPFWNAQMRTTCVATMLSGGHAENALPQTASATVNCRLLPVDNAADVEGALKRVLGDEKISVKALAPAKAVSQKPMNPSVLEAVTAAAGKLWPGLPIIPEMDTGATDGIYVLMAGIPVYGVSGIFADEDDNRYHGRDERILVKSYYDELEFLWVLASRLAQ